MAHVNLRWKGIMQFEPEKGARIFHASLCECRLIISAA
ncbi:hypothetical protein ATCR1_19396 [Agrobacterium tumefaciens CCNWGS0286]|nr:hypothetical protein ATCR1_19396 [Agrobacterium tumefaciens CCNWGS0286]EPR07183.1 hypothetical protein L902_19525 [Agrobacterium radiobacter DSM 30147]EPR19629.1 hypothetical protein L902_10765 [Agrobacterium radiobacter DSM 30147]